MRVRTFYLTYVSPSTYYYRLVRQIYRMGFHPKSGSFFHARVLENEIRQIGKIY